MAEIGETSLVLEDRINYFPWITKINKRFSRSFPNDYDEETLNLFNREIEQELQTISIHSKKRNEALLSTLLCFYNHFCWKVKWKKPSPFMASSCAKILSGICRVGLVLSKGDVKAKWINQVLSAIKMFPGSNNYLYDALLQITTVKKKYHSAYTSILRHTLSTPQSKIEHPSTYFKLMLLLRRLKFSLGNPCEKTRIDALAAGVAIPKDVMAWLAENGLQDVSKSFKENKLFFMRKTFGNAMRVRLRKAVLPDVCNETSPIAEYEVNQFSIDCIPETVAEVEPKFSNGREDIGDAKTSKSKRKHTANSDEENKSGSTKKKKKDNKFCNIEVSDIQETPIDRLDSINNLETDPISTEMYSDLPPNSTAFTKSHKKGDKKNKIDMVVQKDTDKTVYDLSSNETCNVPKEINDDSVLIKSYSSAIESIKKGKKKRNTITIGEVIDHEDAENFSTKNDLSNDQSIMKGKKKRKTINIVEHSTSGAIENPSNFDEKELVKVHSTKKDKNKRKSKNFVQENVLKDIESQSVIDDEVVQPTKKSKKRKTIDIAREINFSDSENQSEPDVSLYVQSKNRRKTINTAQDLSQKVIQVSLYDSSIKKGKKKRKTVSIMQEINPEDLTCVSGQDSFHVLPTKTDKKQRKISENLSNFSDYDLCVQNENPTSPSTHKTMPKKNKKKSSKFTSADFVVTPCENVDVVAKEGISSSFSTDTSSSAKRSSTSKKNEWVVTADSNEPPKSRPCTLKTPPEKHSFEVSNINENLSETVSVETLDSGENEFFAEAHDIVKSVAYYSESEEDKEKANVADTVFETESVGTVGDVNEANDSQETPVAITNNSESEEASTEDEEKVEVADTVFETESVDTAKNVDEANYRQEITVTITYNSESEEASTEDEEKVELVDTVCDTESVDAVENVNEDSQVRPVAITYDSESEVASTEDDEKVELVDTVCDTESVNTFENVNSCECAYETVTCKHITVVQAVKCVEDDDTIDSSKETETIEEFTDNTVAPSRSEDTEEENVEVTVKTSDKTEHVANNKTEISQFIENPEKSVKQTEEVEIAKNSEPEEIVEETNAVNSREDVGSCEETEDISSSKPISETQEATEIIPEINTVEMIKGAEDISSFNKIKDFEPIPETQDPKEGEVASVEDNDVVEIIEETENIDSINKTEDFESIPETQVRLEEKVDTVQGNDAVEIIEETENLDSINKTEIFESIPETQDQKGGEIGIAEDNDVVDIIEETENIDSTNKIEDFEPIPETEVQLEEKVDTIQDNGPVEVIEETENIDTINKTEDFEPIPETQVQLGEKVDNLQGNDDIEVIEETENIDSINEANNFKPILETEDDLKVIEFVDVVKESEVIEEMEDLNSGNKTTHFHTVPDAKETIDDMEASRITEEIESVDMIDETDNMDSSNRTEYNIPISETVESTVVSQLQVINDIEKEGVQTSHNVELLKNTNTVEFIDEKVKTRTSTETVKTAKKEEVKMYHDHPKNLEPTDKTGAKESVDELKEMECIADTENSAELHETKNFKDVPNSSRFIPPLEPSFMKCISEIKDLLEVSKQLDLLKSQVVHEATKVSEQASGKKNFEGHSTESVPSQMVTPPQTSYEEPCIREKNPNLTQDEESPLLQSETNLSSSQEETAVVESEEDAPINNTQDYCKILVKEVTEDKFTDDSDAENTPNLEAITKNKNVSLKEESFSGGIISGSQSELDGISSTKSPASDTKIAEGTISNTNVSLGETADNCETQLNKFPETSTKVDVSNSKLAEDTISNTNVSLEETADNCETQLEKIPETSTEMDVSNSKLAEDTISSNKVFFKETETVESIAEGLYRKALKAEKERLSLIGLVPDESADVILTESSASNINSFEDLKKQAKFTPESSQLPKLGNLSDLKPFGFPSKKLECLSFVDVSKDKDSNELESSMSSPVDKRKDFYPYRNLVTTDLPDDKSESNFSEVVPDDKLEETICVSDEDASSGNESDEATEIDEDFSQSPIFNDSQGETVGDKPKSSEESQSLLESSSKLESEELIKMVCTMQVPIVNLGRKCDDEKFVGKVDVASSYSENEIPSTELKRQNEMENIVEGKSSQIINQESQNDKPESSPEKLEVVTTRNLRSRTVSPVVKDKTTISEMKHETPEKSSRRLRPKPTKQESKTSPDLRRSTRRLKKDINTNLRDELNGLRLGSPLPAKRKEPISEVGENVNSEDRVNYFLSTKRTTRSTASKKKGVAISKCEEHAPSAENERVDIHKEASNHSSDRKRATSSTSTKNNEYFPTQTKKAQLTPINETESEDPIEDSAETSTENLPAKKRFTRSTKNKPIEAEEDNDSFPRVNKSSDDSAKTVKRSTRASARAATRSKLSQNQPIQEESDEENMETQSNVSDESLKENVADEENSADSRAREHNLRRSARNMIRPARLKLSQDNF